MKSMTDAEFIGFFESLSREISEVKTELKADMKDGFQRVETRLERIEARLDRQGGIINGGTRQVARLITWSERMDLMPVQRDSQIEELTKRLTKQEDKLEGKA
jgi:hypothetical protein